MEHYYQNIQGWFRAEELYKQMVAAAPSDEPSHFVEIGCWKGRSTAFLGVEIINSGKPITLHVVDTFKGSNELAHIDDPDIDELYDVFMTNMEALIEKGLRLRTWEEESIDFAEHFKYDAFFVFIDAEHTYDAVKNDIIAWLPHTTDYIAGDDFDWIDVNCAVRDNFPKDKIQTDGASWLVKISDILDYQVPKQRPPRVFIATPTHDCKVWVGYMDCLQAECQELEQAGIEYVIGRYDGDSFISRCRDVMTAEFLSNTQCTHIMWIDSDITWPIGIVKDFVLQNKPIIAGAYPKKTLPINFVVNSTKQDLNIIENRYIEVKDAGTGFLCIRRDVFEAISDQCPRLFVRNLSYWPAVDDGKKALFESVARAYFSEMLEEVDGVTISGEKVYNRLTEDYAFCRRAQKAGFSVLLAPLVPLAHHGSYVYDGDVAQHIEVEDGLTLREAVDNACKAKASQ